MTTQNTHPENNDWQEPAGDQVSASETSNPLALPGSSVSAEQGFLSATQTDGTPAEATEPDVSAPVQSQVLLEGELFSFQTFIRQEAPGEIAEQSSGEFDASFIVSNTAVEEQFFSSDALSRQQTTLAEGETPALFALEGEIALPGTEDAVRPFTDFIEEFRQREVRLNSFLNEKPDAPFAAFVAETDLTSAVTPFAEDEQLSVVEVPIDLQKTQEEAARTAIELEASRLLEEAHPGLTQPTLPAERPVSPLLRPATRIRLPRHGRHRIEELIQPGEIQAEPAKSVSEPSPEEKPVPEAPQQEAEQPARPARRYRFDRPAASTSASLAPVKTKASPISPRGTSTREKQESALRSESVVARPASNGSAAPAPVETPAPKVAAQETVLASSEVETPAPAPSATERRRRSSHDRQREKEQQAAQIIQTPEVSAPEPEPAPPAVEEIPLEDLPPLEYAELQAANSRRRRRRRAGTASTVPASNGATPSRAVLPEPAAPALAPTSAVIPLPKSTPAAPVPSPTAQSYNIVSGYTVSQMNQGNDNNGPFMGPEPSPARGSTFMTSPTLRHVRNEVQRSTPSHTPKHSEAAGSLISAASVNYLAQTVTQAVQSQTDRMVAELRRANQVPTTVSVSLPPFPSTERVGVFVDVANLLYSARTLRMTVDFGKLLDFLRGNRRLVRAQAYCPTSPQPGDDQMFLQAVKGLGYRITTKNYKTFSSGAKKADLDLDLCMDVVRLVDGKAVDCIVLVSGDSDFMPMLDYCSDHGVRVEVAAFDESMSATLRQSCDLFVNLSMLEEIRA